MMEGAKQPRTDHEKCPIATGPGKEEKVTAKDMAVDPKDAIAMDDH